MTTREWFRVQRGALWARDPRLALQVWRIANVIDEGHNWARGLKGFWDGPFVIWLDREEAEIAWRRQERLAQIEAIMQRVLEE